MNKNILRIITIAACACTMSAPAFSETTSDKLMKRSDRAALTIAAMSHAEDKSIPTSLLERATCIVTIPDMVRGGFIFGAKYGQGLASCRVAGAWGAPSYVSIKGGNWGLQIGAQAIDLVLVFTRSNAIDRLSSANFTLGGEASVAAGPIGRDLQAGTDYKLSSEIYSYSRTRGVFAGLTVEGAVLRPNKTDNAQVYSKTFTPANILAMAGQNAPLSVQSYVHALNKNAR